MRNTENLLKIVSAIKSGPISAKDLHESLPDIDKSVIYRTIKRLESNGDISKVQLAEGETVYEKSNLGHHHHLICKKCTSTKCIELPDYFTRAVSRYEKEISENYLLNQHRIDFIINCKNCE